MIQTIRSAWITNRHRLTVTCLAFLCLSLFLTYRHHRDNEFGIATSRATGLSAIADGQSMWATSYFAPWSRHNRRTETARYPQLDSASGSVEGLAGGTFTPTSVRRVSDGSSPLHRPSEVAERQVVRAGTFEIISPDPLQTAERLRALALELSGFVVNFSASGSDPQSRSAQLNVSIPAGSFDKARAQVRKIAGEVVRETVEAHDVTRDYVDRDAALRNAHAEEAQYLAILKHATAVKDILEVSSRLSDVRARIDASEADLRLLRTQIDMSSLTIYVTAREEARLFGIHWRPLYEAKQSLRSALVGLADYADDMVALLAYIPLMVIWACTILAMFKIAWMAFRRFALLFFPGFTWLRRSAKPQAA
jgi:Domain of unknown function (DUF4349)